MTNENPNGKVHVETEHTVEARREFIRRYHVRHYEMEERAPGRWRFRIDLGMRGGKELAFEGDDEAALQKVVADELARMEERAAVQRTAPVDTQDADAKRAAFLVRYNVTDFLLKFAPGEDLNPYHVVIESRLPSGLRFRVEGSNEAQVQADIAAAFEAQERRIAARDEKPARVSGAPVDKTRAIVEAAQAFVRASEPRRIDGAGLIERDDEAPLIDFENIHVRETDDGAMLGVSSDTARAVRDLLAALALPEPEWTTTAPDFRPAWYRWRLRGVPNDTWSDPAMMTYRDTPNSMMSGPDASMYELSFWPVPVEPPPA